MTDAALALPERTTLAEFLTWDDGTDRRYELVDGVVTAMTPPEYPHTAIAAALSAALVTGIGRNCELLVEAGMRPDDSSETYFQADLVVTCARQSIGARFVSEPRLVVEVLSPSTAAHDCGAKVPGYRTIASVEEILLVYSDSVRAELWRRSDEGWTVLDLIWRDTILRLDSVGVEITLGQIYGTIEFQAADPEPETQ